MPFQSPVAEYLFVLDHVVGYDQVMGTERFSGADRDTAAAVLTEAGRLCDDIMAPLRRDGDLHPARLENGVTRTSPGFAEGYKAIAEGGWVGAAATPDHGGLGLPMSVVTGINEMMAGANLSLQLAPLLTQGQIEALEHHASEELKEQYLPKLISGEWTGTMNLTEPQAGSDVGALRSTAVENGDGSYAISGQKIYISWGDHDVAENICHLVLARLPDGGPGTKGISLFLVPKFIPDEQNRPGVANGVKTVSLEHKLGIHGSPTAVLQYEGATGWLVGKPHGGMAAMFTMMNNARLGVGGQGIGIAEGAYQHALAYAIDRQQGPTPTGTAGIVDHADVRRMLTTMKADIFAARCMALDCAVAIDMSTATGDAGWKARAALLTPLAKSFGTDIGMDVAREGVQVHGGMGVIEETGAAQFSRDVRVTAIYEGTNGIQAMDLVARKMADGGDAAFALIDEIVAHAETARARFPKMAEAVWSAAETLRETTEWVLAQKDLNERFAGAVAYQRGFARVLGAHYHLRAAMVEAEEGSRTKLARIYITRLLPEHTNCFTEAVVGAEGLYALSLDELAA
ncbi:MAG: acyl-CoA dehydrogenase [Mangrovicoccus sp.]|nr:acyl-CoA dehydrogenase [Mangrovicoccus sp.]